MTPEDLTEDIPEPEDGAYILTNHRSEVMIRDDEAAEDEFHWFFIDRNPRDESIDWPTIVEGARLTGSSIWVMEPTEKLL